MTDEQGVREPGDGSGEGSPESVPGATPEVATAGPATAPTPPPVAPRRGRRKVWIVAAIFLLPALLILGALVVYPIFFSILCSFSSGTCDAPGTGDSFVGLDNYVRMFTTDRTLTAIRNNLIWVVFAPTIATALGLIFAVLTERVRWGTAFKIAVFMPMAISFLSAGVIWRLVYQGNPEQGLANAAIGAVVDTVRGPGAYPGARPSQEDLLRPEGKGFDTTDTFSTGETVNLGLLAVNQELIPESAQNAQPPDVGQEQIGGVVWLDFTLGGGGESGQVDPTERGLPGATIAAVRGGEVVATVTSEDDGSYLFEGLEPGSYTLRLTEDTFREPFGGIAWLGPSLVTPAIIVSFIWIWTGFALVVIASGLAAIPRDVLEAARVDGASEWQVFRRVTVPLLMPVITVVLVSLIINVLKIFDLVFVIAPGSSQANANVIALEMWKTAFGGGNFPLGSALVVFLFLLVVPAMLFNIRRFRIEEER